MTPLVTERLILRSWREEDKPPFAAMNADPEVMRFFPALLTRAESDAMVDRLAASEAECGMTFFAAEEQLTGRFIGTIGMRPVADDMPLAPAVEIGWRLARDVWGQGLAPEGARAVLRAGFDLAGLERMVAYTAAANTPSRRVMEKIGMVRDPGSDFEYSRMPEHSPLRRHVVYVVERDAWLKSAPAVVGS